MNKFKLLMILVLVVLLAFASGCGEAKTAEDSDIQSDEKGDSDVMSTEADPEDVQPIETGIVYSDNGDIHITESGVTLIGVTAEKDLYIDETVGDGDFTLQDVEIKGTLYVNGGGANSGYLINVEGSEMTIGSKDGTRVVCTNTIMEGITLLTSCTVETDNDGLKNVTVGSEAQGAIDVLMKGEYPEVTIESAANVTISGSVNLLSVLEGAGMTSINMVDDSKVYFYACNGQSVTVTGGAIIEAWINAEYCSLPENTDVISSETGIATVKLGEVDYEIIEWATPESGNTEEGTEVTGIFAEGYPKISGSGATVTVVVILETPGHVYGIIEGSEISLEEISASDLIYPGSNSDNPDYIPIYNSISVDEAGQVYTFTITNPGVSPAGGTAVFIIAVDADGNESPIYRFGY